MRCPSTVETQAGPSLGLEQSPQTDDNPSVLNTLVARKTEFASVGQLVGKDIANE